MEKRARHGKRASGRRLIVSVSLDDSVLMDLEKMQTILSGWRGRQLSRSEVIRRAVRIASAAMRGEDVSDGRRF